MIKLLEMHDVALCIYHIESYVTINMILLMPSGI